MYVRFECRYLNVAKMSIVCYECLKDVLCTLWMFKRCLLYVIKVKMNSFVRYGCFKDVLCTLCQEIYIHKRYSYQKLKNIL